MDGIARHKNHFMNYSTFFVRCKASLLLAVHIYAFSSLIHCALTVSLCRSLPTYVLRFCLSICLIRFRRMRQPGRFQTLR